MGLWSGTLHILGRVQRLRVQVGWHRLITFTFTEMGINIVMVSRCIAHIITYFLSRSRSKTLVSFSRDEREFLQTHCLWHANKGQTHANIWTIIVNQLLNLPSFHNNSRRSLNRKEKNLLVFIQVTTRGTKKVRGISLCKFAWFGKVRF